jgi:acetoacetyl-CoA synthetase
VVGEPGELVIRQPIPSMPEFFWGDPSGARYRASYFEQYSGFWTHGDRVCFDTDGSCVVLGRSDATLNRGGVRMGTAEFYSVLDSQSGIADSLVIDTSSAETPGGDLILLLEPAEGAEIDEAMIAEICSALRNSLSPRHVPDEIVVVDRLPHTRNGKRIEVPVKRMFCGLPLAQAIDPGAVDDIKAVEAIWAAALQWRSQRGLANPDVG